ncbi:OmpA family protein [Steroidobacter sp. S1-65]|uniref:OmpA family protein n=1 Tax=Steroidobacter gossypii TaxID=2805490 RepID=A0ABS1WZD4_9GAMM|nr:OmpA family protein [Steroidobacter gossypii]MBM0106338.1 OmpA family protein [Steroidobacter gossypii]
MKNRILFCAISLALASNAPAGEAGRWYVTPQVGGLITDDDRNIEDGDTLVGLSVGKHVSERWSIELNANGAHLDAFDPYAASLDVLRVFRRDESLSPYLTVGAGGVRNDVKMGRDSTDFIAQAGAGLIWKLGENSRGTGSFSLRPEIKARWDDVGRQGHFTDYIATLGFQFAFGGTPPAPAPQPTVQAPPAAPAPAPAPAPAAPADSDDDGVIDSADRCPGTPRGVAVDSSGCPQQGEITLVGVGFETNSDTLTAESRAVLDPVAANLKKYPELQIELQGHTDSVGADKYNLSLSQRRADSVRAYLLSEGVSASQVMARGYGESQPVANNGTPEGRAQNRRVVMKVLRNPGSVEVKGESRN